MPDLTRVCVGRILTGLGGLEVVGSGEMDSSRLTSEGIEDGEVVVGM